MNLAPSAPAVLVLTLAACALRPGSVLGGPDAPHTSPTAIAEAAPAPAPTPPVAALAPLGAPVGGGRRLTLDQARHAMVDLINRDRASMGLSPVQLDEGAAGRAAQAHAEDMATHGYLGHWGTDGSVPEQRYTEAGGTDMVLENASCFTDERGRTLDRGALIDPTTVEQAEGMFFHEQPPNDGHRRNILKPWHARVGIGVAQPVATPTEIPVPCFSQEFVDSFGAYAPIPPAARVGDTLHVGGAISPPATFAGVGLARVEAPHPLSVADVNRRRSYPVPSPYEMVWPPGFQTPIPVQLNGNQLRRRSARERRRSRGHVRAERLGEPAGDEGAGDGEP